MQVRCNNCMWTGDEESLVLCRLAGKLQEMIKGCPHCHTDEFLMDISEEHVKCPNCGKAFP